MESRNRRRFLKNLGKGAAGYLIGAGFQRGLLAQSAPPAPPTNVRIITGSSDPASTKQVLTSADFRYLGAFRPPLTAGGVYTAYGTGGLTHRYVNGELRLLATNYGSAVEGCLYEMRVPALGDPVDPRDWTAYPSATVATYWGDVYGDRRYATGNANCDTYALLWDESTRRLYWAYSVYYNAAVDDPSIGYSLLDDASVLGGVGRATPVAAYRVAGVDGAVNSYRHHSGLVRIPKTFADAYCQGRTLGVGMGGWWATGAASSLGPVLTAVDHPSSAHLTAVRGTPILDYGNNFSDAGDPIPARRDADYRDFVRGRIASGSTTTGIRLDILGGATWPKFYDSTFDFPAYSAGNLNYGNRRRVRIIYSDGEEATGTTIAYTDTNLLTLATPLANGRAPGQGDEIEIEVPKWNNSTRSISGTTGYWTMVDYSLSGGVWIDGPSKHGFVMIPTLGAGWMGYIRGGPWVEKYYHELWIYDPRDLASTITGTVQRSHVEAHRSALGFRGLPRSISPAPPPNSGDGLKPSEGYLARKRCAGMTYDAATMRLYVLIRHADGSTGGSMIYVFQVNA